MMFEMLRMGLALHRCKDCKRTAKGLQKDCKDLQGLQFGSSQASLVCLMLMSRSLQVALVSATGTSGSRELHC